MKYLYVLLLPAALGLLTREPAPPPASSRNSPEERWLRVPLNNFHGDNTETFPMRYYYNGEHAGEHVVIFVGGGWEISPAWAQAGLAYELATLIGAGVFYTEHRYYGHSSVGNETSLAQLRYLNVDQALGDLAHFIRAVQSPDYEDGRFQNGSVILVGCSYAGSMATWMRLAYPHLVTAAFSDSGPLQAQEDFPEYLEIITEALRQQGGPACLAAVEESVEALAALLQTPTGPGAVSGWFNTCTPVTTAPLDLATFHWFGVTESFAHLVQYATPGAIPAACAALTNTTIVDPVERLARWVRAQPLALPCVEASYSKVVAEHSDTSYSSPKATMRLWTYQTCAEYGWYQTTSSSGQPFLSTVPLEYFHQMCKDFFSTQLDEAFLRRGIERTNLFFGGLSHLPDHVVSVAGGHDPWSPVGPNATHATHKSPVYVVPNVSHCRAISGTGSSDTEELHHVKQEVLSFLYEKAKGQPLVVSGASATLGSMTALAGLLALALW